MLLIRFKNNSVRALMNCCINSHTPNGKILVKLTRSQDQVPFCSNPARITQSNCQQFPGPVQSADLVSAHFIVTLLIKCTKRLYVQKMNLIVLPHKLLQ